MWNILLIIMGVGLIVFNERFVHSSLAFQNKVLKLQYEEKEVYVSEVWARIFGIFFIGLGLYNLINP